MNRWNSMGRLDWFGSRGQTLDLCTSLEVALDTLWACKTPSLWTPHKCSSGTCTQTSRQTDRENRAR